MMKRNETRVSPYDISVVCQGEVNAKLTQDCLNSIRKSFPDAEIILSTWTGSDVSGVQVDKVVFSEDPGAAIADEVAGTMNNVNRQLISTRNGLHAATRPYILKTRTDIQFRNADFLAYYSKYDDSPSLYFKNRLLICSYYTRNPRILSTCFHPSDWLLFGRAEDVCKYYENIPLMTDEDSMWFKSHEKRSAVFTNYICRYTPEQHIFLSFLRTFSSVKCDSYYDRTQKLVEQTEQAIAECFVVLDYGKQLDIVFSKYDPNRYLEKHTLVRHWQWRGLYNKYCQKRSTVYWIWNILYAGSFRILTKIRTCAVRLLDRAGLKEQIKVLLNRRKIR